MSKKKPSKIKKIRPCDYRKMGIKRAYWKWFDAFVGDQDIVVILKNYVRNFKNAKKFGVSLYLNGGQNTGKTLLANITAAAVSLNGHSSFVTDVGEIMQIYAGTWSNDEDKIAFFEMIKNVDLLVIDDIGKTNSNEGVRDCLDALLRYRVQDLRPIIFTSNVDTPRLEAIYGEGICSLIERSVKVLDCPEVDYTPQDEAGKDEVLQNG